MINLLFRLLEVSGGCSKPLLTTLDGACGGHATSSNIQKLRQPTFNSALLASRDHSTALFSTLHHSDAAVEFQPRLHWHSARGARLEGINSKAVRAQFKGVG